MASVTCRRLRVQCGPGERLIQRSAYDQPYFHTSSVDLLSTSIQNSPIYCMWKNNFTEKVNSNEYKTKKKWYKNNMQCLKEETPVLDLISKGNVTIRSLDQTVVVRSHEKFPWNYRYCSRENYSLVFKTGEEHLQNYQVVVQVLMTDISDQDHLYLVHSGKSRIIPPGPGPMIPPMNITDLQSVELKLNLSRSTSRGCRDSGHKGFLLCMKLAETTNHKGTTNVCDDVMNNDNLKVNQKPKKRKNGKRHKKRKNRKRRNKRNHTRRRMRE
ncbi:uncharacterized protein LOC111126989 isoform X2 [Crassostrea virginica]